ncbi:MAG: hypothetical protein KDD45_16330, partial [Bdellovibrionales bacterium]|nr:hypothetical protein [Bdellovibrionales bacterium]
SLDVLLGMSPMNFISSLSLSGDASRIILRQTSITRTKNGIQIYVRKQKASLYGVSLDVNYFINLLKIRSQSQKTDLSTDAFVINYDPSIQDNLDVNLVNNDFIKKNEKIRENLRPVLVQLFKNNSTELLYQNFRYQKFAIDHELNTHELRTKLLWMRTSKLQEDHLVKIRYPESELYPDLNPKDEEIILFSSKKGQLVGRDLLGFAFDLFQAIINKNSNINWQLNPDLDPNPANTPYGKSYWRLVTTEGDLSTTQKRNYPNIATLQHVWGGWNLSQKSFFSIVDQVQDQFKNTHLAGYRLLEKENFHQVKSIDFYRITAQLSLLPGALKRITDLIVQPELKDKPKQKTVFLGTLFKKLSEALGHRSRPEELQFFNEMMKIFGDGDYSVGLASYNHTCEEYYRQQNPENSSTMINSGYWLNGNYYECLAPWSQKLIELSARFPQNKKDQVKWLTEVLYVLDEQIPVAQLMKYLGAENYIYLVRINGFRTGDEDGDIQYFSNTLGDPTENIDYANGLIQLFATRTGISPIELDRTEGSFR